MKKILALLTAVMMLSACGSKNESKVTVCSGSSDGVEVVNTIKYTESKVTSITYQNTITFDEGLADYVESAAQQYQEAYSEVEGMTYEYTITGTTIVETTVVDYEVADLENLVSLGLIDTGENETVDYIDYELTLSSMADIGLTCVDE